MTVLPSTRASRIGDLAAAMLMQAAEAGAPVLEKSFSFPHSPLTGVPLASPFGISGILELIGGALLVVGLYTRASAFVLSGMAAAAHFYVHSRELVPDPERR